MVYGGMEIKKLMKSLFIAFTRRIVKGYAYFTLTIFA